MATGLTATYNIPYPLLTDQVNVHGDLQDMAEQLEDVLLLKAQTNISNAFTTVNTFTATSSDPVVTITQNGSGLALLVDNANPLTGAFSIDKFGNVGIKKSSPEQALDIVGHIAVDGIILAGDGAYEDYTTLGTSSIAISTMERTGGNTVTVTTSSAHGLSKFRDIVIDLTPNDPDLEGTFIVSEIVSPTIFKYTLAGTNFASTAKTGTVSTIPGYTNPVAIFYSDANDYTQVAFRNANSGTKASTDIIVYSDNGDDFSGAMDLGVTSSTFADPEFTITGVNDGYIFYTAPIGTTGNGDLVLATDSTGQRNAIVFAAGGLSSNNTQMTIIPDTAVHIDINTASTSATTGAFTVVGGAGIQGALSVDGLIRLTNTVYIGAGAEAYQTSAGLINSGMVFELNGTPYAQMAIHNADANSSSDYVAYADDGVEAAGYIDLGINSGDFDQLLYGITGPHDGYLFMEGSRPEEKVVTFKQISSGIATITTSTAHGYTTGNKIILTDVGSNLDGLHTLLSASGSSFTFATTEGNLVSTAVTAGFSHKPYGNANLVFATGANGLKNSIVFAAGGFSSGTTQMEIIPDQEVHIEIATPSISPTTGALTVLGGVGILGDMNVQGNVNIAGTISFGGSGTTVVTDNLAVSDPAIFVGTGSQSTTQDLSFIGEYPVTVSTITKSINNKQYVQSTDTATFQTTTTHTFLVGDIVVITGVDTDLNGTYQIKTVPTTTTFTVTKTGISDIPSTAVSPTGTAAVSLRRKFFGMSRDGADSIIKFFEGATTKPSGDINYAESGVVYSALKAGSIELITALAITSGGTGATTAQGARTNILPSQVSAANKYLMSNGTDVSWTTVDALPSQTGNSGKYLTTDGTTASWAIVDLLPSQTGNSGKFLTTNGTVTSWAAISGGVAQTSMPSVGVEGQIWLDTDGTTNPTSVELTRWTKTVSGSPVTTFTGTGDESTTLSYTVGTEQVFLNGVMLVRGSDYSAISGTDIVLTSAAAVGDTLQVLLLPPVNVANVVNNSLFDAKGDLITASGDNLPIRLGVGNNGTFLIADSAQTGGLTWTTTSTFSINSSGNVAIGGASSGHKLHVYGNTGNTVISVGDPAAVAPFVYLLADATNGVGTLQTRYASPLTIGTNNTERLRFDTNNSAKFSAQILESATVSATAATGTINYDVITNKNVLYYTTNASGNFTINVRGNSTTTLNSMMDTGQSLTVVFMNTNGGTAYYHTGFQVDGVSITPKWQGGTAPSSGNINSVDIYTYTIIKTASATYTVLSSQTKFA